MPNTSAATREPQETYTDDYSQVHCPYCDGINDLSESIQRHGESLSKWDCDDCGKTFSVSVNFSISVTAKERP